MLRYKTKSRPGLVALYDIRPGNGAGPFLQPRSPHGAGRRKGGKRVPHQRWTRTIVLFTFLLQGSKCWHTAVQNMAECNKVFYLVYHINVYAVCSSSFARQSSRHHSRLRSCSRVMHVDRHQHGHHLSAPVCSAFALP